MALKTIASALIIGSSMLLSGGAYAQLVIGGAQVTDGDLPKVQERCDQLALADDTRSAAESASDDSADSSDGSAAVADAAAPDAEAVNELADATTPVDLEIITLEACAAAGLADRPL